MIESAPQQGHNLTNRDLTKPGPGSLMQTSRHGGTPSARNDTGADQADAGAAALTCAPMDVSVQDWDMLFCAVEERLRRIVIGRNAGTAHLPMHDMGGVAEDAVAECLDALEQLHAALTQERERAKACRK